MATTTNYSWTTPDDTALVKDGAAAIRTLGSSVDTTVKNLNPETTLGDIAYRSSTANVKTRLALGTAGQVLQVNSGATAPEWATLSAGGMTLIQEQTASANSAIDFTSISGSYKQLFLAWTGISHSAGSTAFSIRLNSNTGSVYATMGLFTQDSLAQYNGSIETSFNGSPFGSNITGSTLKEYCHGQLLIDNYASTTRLKNFNTQFSYTDGTANRFQNYQGVFNSTSAITSINVFRVSGSGTMSNIANTSIRLYGIS